MEFKESKTYQNLQKALAGESIARNKYTYFAQVARDNGDEKVAVSFEHMAINEMMHAKFWFEHLNNMPKTTNSCLIKAAQGEFDEWHSMYPEFAKQAREEGYEDIAAQFDKVAAIEHNHENRFLTLLAGLRKTDEVVKEAPKQKKIGYRCQFCGAISENHVDVCDVCKAIGSFEKVEYFE